VTAGRPAAYYGQPGLGADALLAGQADQRPGAVLSYQLLRLQATASESGAAVVSLPAAGVGQIIDVERISVQTTSTTASTAAVTVGGMLVDYSDAANGDISEEFPPVRVPGDMTFSITWAGLSAGAEATAVVQCVYRSAP